MEADTFALYEPIIGEIFLESICFLLVDIRWYLDIREIMKNIFFSVWEIRSGFITSRNNNINRLIDFFLIGMKIDRSEVSQEFERKKFEEGKESTF